MSETKHNGKLGKHEVSFWPESSPGFVCIEESESDIEFFYGCNAILRALIFRHPGLRKTQKNAQIC